MPPVKVVHVITGLSTGGAERSLVNLCCSAQPDNVAHHVISLLPPADMAAPLRQAGVSVDHVGMVRGLPTPRALARLVRLLRELQPDLIQGWMYHGNIAASAAALFLPGRVPVAWNIRNSLYSLTNEKPLTRWLIRVHRWLSSRPGLIVYNGRLSRQQHEQFGFNASRGLVIPNGFDLQRFVPSPGLRQSVRRSLAIPDEARLVGNVARLHPVKDHRALLQAMAPLMASADDIHLLLIGRNVEPDNEALSDLFDALPMNRVHCLGERRDVESLLPALDLFCSSSYAEAFPNALAEAMACGVPCVATDAGDSAYIVGDTGMVVPVRDVAALSGALDEFLQLPGQRRQALGQQARQRIEENFSVDAAVDAYQHAWQQLLSGWH